MTAADLAEIIRSPDFKNELTEISSYLASIVQERPLVYLLAKCLWKQKRAYALERYKNHDLTVRTLDASAPDKTTLEVKFSLEWGAAKLAKELRESEANAAGLSHAGGIALAFFEAKIKKNNRGTLPTIFKDILVKRPNLFLWVVCSRNLGGVPPSALEWIVGSAASKSHRRKHPYETDRTYLDVVDSVLNVLMQMRPFSVTKVAVETYGDFPSTYHFVICEFADGGGLSPAPARQELRPPDNACRPEESQEQQ